MTKLKKMSTEKANTEQNVEMKKYTMNEEIRGIIRSYLGTKPFIEVAEVIPMISIDVLTEEQINTLINYIGRYAYDEVKGIFDKFRSCITEHKESENSPQAENKSAE
jgi:hypothetical protein